MKILEEINPLIYIIFIGIFFLLAWIGKETKRSINLKKAASELNFKFINNPTANEVEHPASRLFEHSGEGDFINTMHGNYNGIHCLISGYLFVDRSGSQGRLVVQTVYIFKITTNNNLPFFEIYPAPKHDPYFLLETVPTELNIKINHALFDNNFVVQGKEISRIKRILKTVGEETMLNYPDTSIVHQGGLLMFYIENHRTKPNEIARVLEGYFNLFNRFNQN